jgi:coenzyme Q-binding protein COQ10
LAIYNIIADVPSYSSFLPYCLSSKVTSWSKADNLYGKRWPQEAVLEVGWGVMRERFKSRIFCSPGKAVEAVWGEGKCKLEESEISHHLFEEPKPKEQGPGSDGEGILTHLWTRWTVKPGRNGGSDKNEAEAVAHETGVSLDIEFRFANPVYAAMSSAVVDGVADLMIETFERRVEEQLGTVPRRNVMSVKI